jgi:hypothetical protein
MKPGQVLTQWFQRYVLGALKSPQDIYREAMQENPDAALASDRFFSVPPDVETWAAPERLKALHRFTSEAYLTQGDKADWQSCDPRLMRWAALFIEYARKRGIPLYVFCATRTEAEQSKAWAAGNSNARYPSSAHNIGEAVDIVHSVFHWDMSKQEWALLHTLGLRALDRINSTLKKADKLELTWGGTFKSLYDPAHWEVKDYRDRLRRLPLADPVRFTPRAILNRFK